MSQLVKNPSTLQETAYNARDAGLIPGSGRSPREGNDNPLQGNILAREIPWQRSPSRYSPWGHKRAGHEWATKPLNVIDNPQRSGLAKTACYVKGLERQYPGICFAWPFHFKVPLGRRSLFSESLIGFRLLGSQMEWLFAILLSFIMMTSTTSFVMPLLA